MYIIIKYEEYKRNILIIVGVGMISTGLSYILLINDTRAMYDDFVSGE